MSEPIDVAQGAGAGAPAGTAAASGAPTGAGTAAATGAPTIDVAVLGGTGYVSGELLRLLSGHPVFKVASVVSTSQGGEPVDRAFPHLAGALPGDLRFEPLEALLGRLSQGAALGVFAATPHGATAALVDRVLTAAEAARADVRVVDLSADFRFTDPARYQEIYGAPHGAPARIPAFTCAVPEHAPGRPAAHAVQPGCFTTAAVLAARPFLEAGLAEADVFVSAVTGSSGSGRTPSDGTHHPARRSTMYAYAPLAHRHEAEMRRLLAVDGAEPEVAFVPHSGPFVRGIHATLRLTLREPAAAEELVEVAARFYQASPFVSVGLEPARLAEVVGTNRARLGVAVRGRTLVVTSAIDNLVKGAAGGGVQWMNRLFDRPEDEGLRLAGLGWL